jgi:Ser/Thr protein kinase RdoA (MazF antagonist)
VTGTPGERRGRGTIATRTRAEDEIELSGGTANRGLVVRVGETVHRPRTPASDAIRALLRHLEDVGFEGAPRYLGEDDEGRDVLEYVEGRVPIAPTPAWALTDEALASVADLLRRYHAAVRSFDPGGHRWLTRAPEAYRGGLVTHNDPNLDNVVFRGSTAVALIDFDLASPAAPLWDVALAARLWVPLRDPADVPVEVAGRTAARLRLFADAYQLPASERDGLVPAARASHTWCYDIVRQGAARGVTGYAQYWTPSAQARDRRGQLWLDVHQEPLTAALGETEAACTPRPAGSRWSRRSPP